MEHHQKMQRELDSIVRDLDRKIIVPWLPKMRLGKPVYDHLLAMVRGKALNRNQTANALNALFRLRHHGREEEVLALLRDHTSHEDKRVRSEAVGLLMRMIRVHNSQPPFQPSVCMADIKAALVLGLEHDMQFHAKRFVGEHS